MQFHLMFKDWSAEARGQSENVKQHTQGKQLNFGDAITIGCVLLRSGPSSLP